MKLLPIATRAGRDGVVIEREAIVDDDDFEELKRYTWYLQVHKTGYFSIGRAPTGESPMHESESLVMLSRHILGIDESGILVYHVNGNPLDNRKENLKVVLDGYGVRRLRTHWLQNTRVWFDFPR